MSKLKFERSKAVRFSLMPGPQVDGKPSTLFKPIENKKSKVSKKEKRKMVSLLSDYDQITINGRAVDEEEIPAFVLEQIRGRKDLLFNQMREEESQGDIYDLEDREHQQDYFNHMQDQNIKQDHSEWQSHDEEWIDQEQQFEEEEKQVASKGKKEGVFELKQEEFPTLEQTKTILIEGQQYQLTEQQISMLDTIIPANYQSMDFGVTFIRYNEDGLLYSQKEQYQKYLLKENQQYGIADTYEHIPARPLQLIDTDVSPADLRNNENLWEVEEALNQEGELEAYQQLEDDFFIQMIKQEQRTTKHSSSDNSKTSQKQKVNSEAKEIKVVKKEPNYSENQIEQQLDQALYNFEHNLEEQKQRKDEESNSDNDLNQGSHNQSASLNYLELDRREEYTGRDGEMDWRFLTKQEKKQYMKTKLIREGYDELREREIQEKMKNIKNVSAQELHLKQLVKHIPFHEDHVMLKSLQQGLKESNQDIAQIQYSSDSDEDDIVSFHQKTSIIATNLSVIQEPSPSKKKKSTKDDEEVSQHNISNIKVVPQKRNRGQTDEERRDRKQRLRELKKQKKEQKKEFCQRFSKIKKETSKRQNHTNPLTGVSYVKIY